MKSKINNIVFIHLGVLLFSFIISSIYFSPVFEGKAVEQHDFKTWQGASKEISDYRNKTAEEPLWTNSMFGGMPAYLISVSHNSNIFKKIYDIFEFRTKIRPVNHIFWLMISFYFLLILFGTRPLLSLIGGIAYAFSSYFLIIIYAGHITKVIALGYAPLLIGGIYYAYKKNSLVGSAISAFFLALITYVNHLQITYYTFFIIIIFIIFQFLEDYKNKNIRKFIKTSIVLSLFAILAVLTNISVLWTTYEYGKYSTRSKSELTFEIKDKTSGLDKSYITGWSYGVWETFTFLIPNFHGGGSADGKLGEKSNVYKYFEENQGKSAAKKIIKDNTFYLYWGYQPGTAGPVYVGAIVVLLFVLGLFLVKGNVKWWLLCATVFSITLAWGKNFPPITNFFINYFPGYNKFRAVTMILIIAEFAMPLLGILAVKEIINDTVSKDKIIKYLKYSISIVGGICIFFLLFASAIFNFNSPYDQEYINQGYEQLVALLLDDRRNLLHLDAFRSLVFIVLSGGLIWIYVKKSINTRYFLIILGFLVLIDMWSIDKRYLNDSKFVRKKELKKAFDKTYADDFILQDKDLDYRVLNFSNEISTFNDANTSYYHKSIGGYHGAKMKRYQELIDYHITDEMNGIINSFNNKTFGSKYDSVLHTLSVLNMLNTKYIIYNSQTMPIINGRRLGNAWFVNNYKIVEDADEEILGLYNPFKTDSIRPIFIEKLELESEYRRLVLIEEKNPEIEQEIKAIIANINILKEKLDRLSYPFLDKTAIINKRFENKVKPIQTDSTASIELTQYSPNHLVYKTSCNTNQLAVFSEIYYDKGWDATIDGKPADYFRTDYILRAMNVPSGKHTIEFKFQPQSYYVGNKISLASSIVLILLIIGIGCYEIFTKKSQKNIING